jgi:hypothetical protein
MLIPLRGSQILICVTLQPESKNKNNKAIRGNIVESFRNSVPFFSV